MILAEGFECTVPSDNAVKGTVINCVGTAPDNYEVVGTTADWLMVLLTGLLVAAAVAAWLVTRRTLKQMQKDSQLAEVRHSSNIAAMAGAESRKVQGEALFELLGVYSEIDEARRVGREALLSVVNRLHVSEQKFVMVNEFPTYPIEISNFHDALLATALASIDPEKKKYGALGAYRRVSGSKNRLYRDFYRGILGPTELSASLDQVTSALVGEQPDFYPRHLQDEYA